MRWRRLGEGRRLQAGHMAEFSWPSGFQGQGSHLVPGGSLEKMVNLSWVTSYCKGAKDLSSLTPGNSIGHPLPRAEMVSQKVGPVLQSAALKPRSCLHFPWAQNPTIIRFLCPSALGNVDEDFYMTYVTSL